MKNRIKGRYEIEPFFCYNKEREGKKTYLNREKREISRQNKQKKKKRTEKENQKSRAANDNKSEAEAEAEH